MSLIQNALEKMRRSGATAAGPNEATGASQAVPFGHPGSAAQEDEPAESQARRVDIDWDEVRAVGYLPAQTEMRRFADFYRQIKRPLIEKALAVGGAPDARLILVSSALPGDGKSFTAINLALSMARERDISVLLVDADLPRSRISEVFGLGGEPGLVDALLRESSDIESYIVHTNVAGLDILPAGVSVDNATELLASERMTQIAGRLATRRPRRLVLFDSAPLLGSTEASALAKIPGQIALVVRAGKTPRQAVVDAVACLNEAKLQGIILNEATTARGSGYYYGYSSYGASGNEITYSQ